MGCCESGYVQVQNIQPTEYNFVRIRIEKYVKDYAVVILTNGKERTKLSVSYSNSFYTAIVSYAKTKQIVDITIVDTEIISCIPCIKEVHVEKVLVTDYNNHELIISNLDVPVFVKPGTCQPDGTYTFEKFTYDMFADKIHAKVI